MQVYEYFILYGLFAIWSYFALILLLKIYEKKEHHEKSEYFFRAWLIIITILHFLGLIFFILVVSLQYRPFIDSMIFISVLFWFVFLIYLFYMFWKDASDIKCKLQKKRMLIFFILLLLFLISFNVTDSRLKYLYLGNEISVNQIEPGDVLFTHMSDVYYFIPGYWTHIGLFVGYDENNAGWIIESSMHGVRKIPLEKFLDYSYVSVGKVKNINNDQRLEVVNIVETNLGKPYNYYIISKRVEGNSYYCSELVWSAYKKIGYDLDLNPNFTLKYFNGVAPQEMYLDNDLDLYYIRNDN